MDEVLSLLDKRWKSYHSDTTNAISEKIHSDEFIQAFKDDITSKWAFNYEGELVLPKLEKLMMQLLDTVDSTEYYVKTFVDEVNKIFMEKASPYVIKYRYDDSYHIYCVKV